MREKYLYIECLMLQVCKFQCLAARLFGYFDSYAARPCAVSWCGAIAEDERIGAAQHSPCAQKIALPCSFHGCSKAAQQACTCTGRSEFPRTISSQNRREREWASSVCVHVSGGGRQRGRGVISCPGSCFVCLLVLGDSALRSTWRQRLWQMRWRLTP